MAKDRIVRMLRVLEYVGTESFINNTLSRRAVKGVYHVNGTDSIREAIIGDTYDLVGSVEVNVPAWQHACGVACDSLTLWIPACPHCGQPHDYKEKELIP